MAPIIIRRKHYIILLLVALLPFIRFIQYITANEMPSECIFCKIIQGRMPETKIEMETSEFVIFADIKPASQYHFLAVSKRHMDSLKNLTMANKDLVTGMESGLRKVLSDKGVDVNDALFGFHMPPFISVKHLHMHGIAPRSSMGIISGFMFRPGTAWFKSVEEAQTYLENKA